MVLKHMTMAGTPGIEIDCKVCNRQVWFAYDGPPQVIDGLIEDALWVLRDNGCPHATELALAEAILADV